VLTGNTLPTSVGQLVFSTQPLQLNPTKACFELVLYTSTLWVLHWCCALHIFYFDS
jgi:hypothetical protein